MELLVPLTSSSIHSELVLTFCPEMLRKLEAMRTGEGDVSLEEDRK